MASLTVSVEKDVCQPVPIVADYGGRRGGGREQEGNSLIYILNFPSSFRQQGPGDVGSFELSPSSTI